MIKSSYDSPSGFGFFSGLSIVVGAVGILMNSALTFLFFVQGPGSESGSLCPSWLSSVDVLADAVAVIGGLLVRRRMDWARKALVSLAAISLAELLYDTASLLHRHEVFFTPVMLFYFLIPLAIYTSIFCYFSRRTVIDFVSGRC